MNSQQLRQRLLEASARSEGDQAWEPLHPDFSAWGWAELPTSMGGSNEDCAGPFAFAEALAASRAYHSTHCSTALAEHTGLEGLHEGMSCSACLTGLNDDSAVEQLRGALKQHINAAWSTEAVRQGVQHAKSGAYEEAHKCYTKALELEQSNADAYVARGAAYANQGHFGSAINDFQHALGLDPGNANADKYCRAVQQRAAALKGTRELTPPPSAALVTPPRPLGETKAAAAGAAGNMQHGQDVCAEQTQGLVHHAGEHHTSKGGGSMKSLIQGRDMREEREAEHRKGGRRRSRSHASSEGSSSSDSSDSSARSSSPSSSEGSESDEGQQGAGEQMDEVQRALHLVMMSRRKDRDRGRDNEGRHKGKHKRKDKGKEKRKDRGKDKRRSKHKKKKKKRK